jgi:hypothetical protein
MDEFYGYCYENMDIYTNFQDVCYEECERIFNVTPNDEEYHRIHSIVKGEVVKYIIGTENMDWYQSQMLNKLTPR